MLGVFHHLLPKGRRSTCYVYRVVLLRNILRFSKPVACLSPSRRSNIVRRRPIDNRTPTPEEMDFYLPFLLEEIGLVDPHVIVLLGTPALFSRVVVVGVDDARAVRLLTLVRLDCGSPYALLQK